MLNEEENSQFLPSIKGLTPITHKELPKDVFYKKNRMAKRVNKNFGKQNLKGNY
jgi:hypothetical protein